VGSFASISDCVDQPAVERQRRNGPTQVIEGGVGHDDQGLGRLVCKSGKGGVEFTRALELDQANCFRAVVIPADLPRTYVG
jgi:hypothetical protein